MTLPAARPAVVWKSDVGKIDHTPAVADVDGDGTPDVVVASVTGAFVLSGVDGRRMWRRDLRGIGPSCAPALALANGDDKPDVVFGFGGVLAVFEGARGDVLSSHALTEAALAADTLSFPGLVVAADASLLLAVNRRGDVDWRGVHDRRVVGAPVCLELGGRAMIALATEGGLCLHDVRDGNETGRVDLPDIPASALTVAGGDLYFGGRAGLIVCVDLARLAVRWKRAAEKRVFTRPAVGDVDGDGSSEVVAGSDDGSVHCLDARTGAVRWTVRTGDSVHGAAAIGDVDGDGRADVVIGSDDNRVWMLDGATGRTAWWFRCEDDVDSGLKLADVDRDGRPEIIAGSNDGHVYVLRVR